jgi:hypothetical protein
MLIAVSCCAGACASTPQQSATANDGDTTPAPLVVGVTDSAGVRGTVLDQGRPVPAARVAVRDPHLDEITDSLGRFNLPVPTGSYVISTYRVGYYRREDTIQVPGAGGLSIQIPLREKPFPLNATCTRLPSGEDIC